ncbi:MAG: Ig-like domain-containing protein [Lachnospiraceae bacterium]
MKWKQGWNGLLISGMLGAGGILMISGGTAAIPRTDYSYAAETAAGTEEGGATSEPESEPESETESETESEKESETGSEQRTENTGVKETDQGLETNIESESETMQELSAVEENRRESEESTEGQFPETELGENGRFEAEAPTTEPEAAEEFETEVSEAETEESEDNETEAPEVAEETETEIPEVAEETETEIPEAAEEFETEVSEAETEESEDNETEAPEETEETETEIPEAAEETETEIPEETEETETEIPEETEAETDPPQTEPRQPETEFQPLQVQRGREYEIRGDENAWFRDDRDRLWVRAGSNVYVQALGTMDYGKGGSVSSVQEDGTLMFQLKQMEPNGQTARVSALQKENYYVDAEAPAAVISGSGEEQNGVLYVAQAANLQVAIEPDGKSGLKKAAYCIRSSVGRPGSKAAGQQDIWKECTDGQQVAISEEGVWKVYVRTEDQVGNLKFSESVPICVDRTAPEITISGVSDQSANSGSLPIQISCEDAYYRPGSLKIQIHGSNGGKAPALKKSEESEQGCLVEYFDFPKEQSYDDTYTLTVEASDLSGNRTQKTAEFSVNRFGSVFDLALDTKKKLKQYYFRHPTDIVFLETNIDYVGASKIFCRENGEVRQLIRGTDYEVTMTGDASSWKQYQYRIPASSFQKEGIYELLLSSEDRANNQSDTGMQGKRVTFALDWTAPECLITGVKGGELCQRAVQTVCFWPQDNVGVRTLKIYKDSELYYQTDTVNTSELPVKIRLSESEEWQTLQAKVCDFAGNECWTPELAVYVNTKGAKTVPYQKQRKSAQEEEEQKQQSAILAPGTIRLHTALQLSAAGMSGEQYVAKAGQIPDEKKENGQKEGEISAVTKLRQQERQRRGKLFLVFGGLLFLSTALVCILPVRKRKT